MGLFSKIFNIENEEINNTQTTTQEYTSSKFHMTIEDVFTITGKGTVVTGSVDSGEIHIGDTVYINEQKSTKVIGIEMFRKTLDYARTGDNCGILLENISKHEVNKGDYLSK